MFLIPCTENAYSQNQYHFSVFQLSVMLVYSRGGIIADIYICRGAQDECGVGVLALSADMGGSCADTFREVCGSVR